MKMPLLVVLMALHAHTGCGGGSSPAATPTSPGSPDPAAVTAYLEEMIGIMQRESANAAIIDWTNFRAEVLAAASGAQTIHRGAYPAILRALQLLNDFESFYEAPGRLPVVGLIGPSPEPSCTPSPAIMSSLPETIGYVKVPSCDCDGPGADPYAEQLQTVIRNADRPGLIGWIVDLREDRGGNMWPMLAGLGPILGEGIVGWIVYNNREYEREYRNGAALSLGEVFSQVAAPYTLMRTAPKVAVLTGTATNSAGEAITVWFKGRPDTRSFGSATCGHHHLLHSFRMSDGANLTLKTAHPADRLKRPYAGPITPDETVANPAEVMQRAITWLQSGG